MCRQVVPPTPLTGAALADAADLIKHDTSLGMDYVEVELLRDLRHHPQAADTLAGILNTCEDKVAWPACSTPPVDIRRRDL